MGLEVFCDEGSLPEISQMLIDCLVEGSAHSKSGLGSGSPLGKEPD